MNRPDCANSQWWIQEIVNSDMQESLNKHNDNMIKALLGYEVASLKTHGGVVFVNYDVKHHTR